MAVIGSGRRTITRPWPAPARPARAKASWSSWSKRTAERVVAQLKEEGVLERQGSPRSGSWTVHVDHNSAHSEEDEEPDDEVRQDGGVKGRGGTPGEERRRVGRPRSA